jgi:aminoglycoside phosphotransferase (APT) family kinase protein
VREVTQVAGEPTCSDTKTIAEGYICRMDFSPTAVSSDRVFGGEKPVDARNRLDEAALQEWMLQHVAGYTGPLRAITQFKGGQSNPTYRLETADGNYVLRRKPFGKLLRSAHAVEREFRVIAALHAAGFPVPKPYALCNDATVIGSAFYVMQHVAGRLFWDGTLPNLAREERRAIYCAQIDTLARLHRLQPQDLGLADFAPPGSYFTRQAERWTKQYRASETQSIGAMEKLIEWLPRTVPPQTQVSVVHGDFRLDNLIFASNSCDVLAVIDWELSTLGDPLADMSYVMMNWMMPADGRSGLAGLDLEMLSIPTSRELIERYCRAMGWEGVPELSWYFAFNLFRLAGIMQGIAKRRLDGTAVSDDAERLAAQTVPVANKAWDFARKAGAS